MGKLRVKKSAGEIRRESKDLKRLIAYAGSRLGLHGQFTAQDFAMAIDQAATIIAQARAQQQHVTVDTAALDAEISKVAESATAGGAQ